MRSSLLSVLLLATIVGCGIVSESMYQSVEARVWNHQYGQALTALNKEKENYGDLNSVLYDLEYGLIGHYANRYEVSNNALLAAERRMRELYTKSITKEVGSYLINDNVLPYEGEIFEKLYVNLFLALNFAEMGKMEDALVEARKVDVKLREYSREYEGKNSFKDDAFIRYVMGALYEAAGEINDAHIAYQNALSVYQTSYRQSFSVDPPSTLLSDLVRTSTLLGFDNDRKRFEQMSGTTYTPAAENEGSLFLVIYSGKGPVKEEYSLRVSIPDTAGIIHTFKIALPKFVKRQRRPRSYRVDMTGEGQTYTEPVETGENITAIAETTLKERIDMVYLKAGGRAILKFLAAEEIKKKLKKDETKENDKDKKKNTKVWNALFSSLTDVVYDASERADIRSWRTLPDRIMISRITVPEGPYLCRLVSLNGQQVAATDSVFVRRGQTIFRTVVDVD